MNLSIVTYSIIKIIYIGCLNHTLLDEILEGKSYLQSLVNLQFWTFDLYHLSIWVQFGQTLGTFCIYTTSLGNCIEPACFYP